MTSPIDGQLWYDVTNKKLRVYDAADGKWNVSSGAAAISTSAPSSPSEGDLWYNSDANIKQLLAYDGTTWRQVGVDGYGSAKFNSQGVSRPLRINVGGTSGLASGNGAAPTGGTTAYAMGTFVSNILVAITTDTAVTGTYFYVDLNDGSNTVQYYSWDGYDNNTVLSAGINILDDASGYKFNGSSRHAETADGLAGVTTTKFMRNDNGSGATDSRKPSTSSLDIGASTNRWGTVWSDTFDGQSVSAKYADLAERYESDMILNPGEVVKIGGTKEITRSTEAFSTDVFGVISTNPAFMMNKEAGNDETHPYVALTGRVPVKVIGAVSKGDRIVCSAFPGVAQSEGETVASGRAVIGRALEDKLEFEVGLIEVVIGAK